MDLSHQGKRALALFAGGIVVMVVAAFLVGTAFFADYYRFYSRDGVFSQIIPNLIGLAVGFGIGLILFFLALPKYRFLAVLLGFALLGAIQGIPTIGTAISPVSGLVGLIAALLICAAFALAMRERAPEAPDVTFGSSRWASYSDLSRREMLSRKDGIFLGRFGGEDLAYAGKDANRHLLTVAPTRAGKGQCAIIPNLLRYRGSAVVIDPKGENAAWTSRARYDMGQEVHIVDPWNIAAGGRVARINPLDLLKADDVDLLSDIAIMADALVPPRQGENDPYWSNQARAFVSTFILYLMLSPDEEGNRNFGRLRDILSLSFVEEGADPDDADTLNTILLRMFQMTGIHAQASKSAASRILSMNSKTRASVFSSAHEATAWLDSPTIRENLSATDVDFDKLKTTEMTIYLVLPVDRLNTFGSWLRIHLSMALQRIVRDTTKPKQPVLFILDEFAAVGRLKMIEDAYAIMAGAGVQLWAIVQDFSQLKGLYSASWQTFIANAGVIQYFGSRDLETAEYISKMCGSSTVSNWAKSIAKAFSRSYGTGSSTSDSTTETRSQSKTGRPLMMVDELMRVPGERQILLVGDCFPIAAEKVYAHSNPEFKATMSKPKEPNAAAPKNEKH